MRSIRKNKKGFAELIPLVLTLGIAIVLLGVMASVAANTRDSITDPTTCGANTSLLYQTPLTCGEAQGHDASGATNNWSCWCAEYNISTSGLDALDTVGGYWGIIVTIGIFVIILGALMTMFKGGARR